MTQVKGPNIAIDRVIPDFSLPSQDGRRVSPSHYKQKANLVIAYLDFDQCGEAINLVETFIEGYSQYRELESEILVVSPQTEAELRGKLGTMSPPFPVLSDEGGAMARAYFGDELPAAAVLITDRFGELRTLIMVGSAEELPKESVILDWLNLIEMECPECGD